MKKILQILTVLVLELLLIGTTPAAAQNEINISVNSKVHVISGSVFVVIVNVPEVTDLNGFEFDISFDSEELHLDNITTGQIGDTEISASGGEISQGTYHIFYSPDPDNDDNPVFSGSGYLAVVHFHVEDPAISSSTLTVSDWHLYNSQSEEIPVPLLGESVTVSYPLEITTESLPNEEVGIEVGTAYSATLEVKGGNGSYSWSISSGSLPDGISLSDSGEISGTPTTAGTFSFTAKVTDGTLTDLKSYELDVYDNDSLEITTDLVPDGVVGITYSATLESTGSHDSDSWSISSGSLPDGISLSNAGEISGTPTEAGTFNFTIEASNGELTASKAYSINVQKSSVPVTKETDSGGYSFLWIVIFTSLLAFGGVMGSLLLVGRQQALKALQAAGIVPSKKTPKRPK